MYSDALVPQQVGGVAERVERVLGAGGRLDVVAERRPGTSCRRPGSGICGDVAPTVMNGMPASWKSRAGGQHGVGVRVADHGLDLVLLDVLPRRLGGDRHVVLAVVDVTSRSAGR